jgi:hypothetical protein
MILDMLLAIALILSVGFAFNIVGEYLTQD